jgi:phage gpG-like protein
MTSSFIEIDDVDVKATLARLEAAGRDLSRILLKVGEGIMERTKRRFDTATAPDGTPWAANARSTIEAFIAAKGGYGKRGINLKGRGLAMEKKPLHGHTGKLAQQFHVLVAGGNSVIVSNSMIYAAMQQFGGKKSEFPQLWGDIPARPFFPITEEEELYPQEQETILEQLNAYLAGAIEG